jgi:hypothetical protein
MHAHTQIWCFDVETKMIDFENNQVDQIICYSYSNGQNTGMVTRTDPDALKILKWLLSNDEILLINQNIAFDFGCCIYTWPELFPLVLQKYDKLLIDDIMWREKLYAIARGYFKEKRKYKGYFSLKNIVDRRFGVQLEKGGVQLQYHLVDNLPIEKYPPEYIEYSLQDSYWPIRIYHSQNESMIQYFQRDYIPDSREQTRAYFGLFLMGKLVGINTDEKQINKVEQIFLNEKNSYMPALKQWQIIRANETTNKKRLQQIVKYAYKLQNKKVPRTDPSKTFPEGQIKTDKETLNIDFPILNLTRKYEKCKWYLNSYIKMLRKGVDSPIFIWYEIADTGRTTASPNIQNQSRKHGIRECYIPQKKDWVFIVCDYSAIEMCTFAQVIFWIVGTNRLQKAINEGVDPHLELARNFPQISMSYNDIIKVDKNHPKYNAIYGASGARFIAKIGNFGYAGGMGPNAFIDYAKAMSESEILLTLDQSQQIKESWLETWPEAREYFRVISNITDQSDSTIEQFVSQRLRGGLTFTRCANTFFQGLAADGCKNALWLIIKACYQDQNSPLYGYQPNAFIHDEFLLSGPKDRAELAVNELSRLMIGGMKLYVPDVQIKTSKKILERWTK